MERTQYVSRFSTLHKYLVPEDSAKLYLGERKIKGKGKVLKFSNELGGREKRGELLCLDLCLFFRISFVFH